MPFEQRCWRCDQIYFSTQAPTQNWQIWEASYRKPRQHVSLLKKNKFIFMIEYALKECRDHAPGTSLIWCPRGRWRLSWMIGTPVTWNFEGKKRKLEAKSNKKRSTRQLKAFVSLFLFLSLYWLLCACNFDVGNRPWKWWLEIFPVYVRFCGHFWLVALWQAVHGTGSFTQHKGYWFRDTSFLVYMEHFRCFAAAGLVQ